MIMHCKRLLSACWISMLGQYRTFGAYFLDTLQTKFRSEAHKNGPENEPWWRWQATLSMYHCIEKVTPDFEYLQHMLLRIMYVVEGKCSQSLTEEEEFRFLAVLMGLQVWKAALHQTPTKNSNWNWHCAFMTSSCFDSWQAITWYRRTATWKHVHCFFCQL